MSVGIGSWVLLHLVVVCFWLWLILWGGAARIEGWSAWLLIGWFAGHWKEPQIRLYALICLIIDLAWFALGMLIPAFRFTA